MTFQEWFFPQKLIKTYLIKHQTSNISSGSSSTNFPLPLHLVSFSLLRSSPIGFSAFRVNAAGPGTPGTPGTRVRDVLESWAPKAPAKAATPAPSRTTKWDNRMDTRNVAKLCSQTQSIHIFPYHKGIFCSEVTRFWRANLQLHASVRAAAAKVVAYPA